MNSMYSKKTAPQAKTPSNPAAASAPGRGRRFQVRQSGIHGKGVFALRAMAAGDRIMEYTGDVITWKAAQKRHPHNPDEPNHTFFFHVDDKHVIDGVVNGNDAKWINHGCDGNCEADEVGGRVFIKAIKDIAPGDELTYDYGLMLEGRHTAKVKKE